MIDVTIMGPRGGRVKDVDESLIYNYIIEACKELKIRQADIEVLVYNKFPSDYDYAIGFCYGDIVQNCFSYHFTPAGAMFEEAAKILKCTVFPAGGENTDLQLEVMKDIGTTAYVGVPDF